LAERRKGLQARHAVAVQRHLDEVQRQHNHLLLKQLAQLEQQFPVTPSQAKANMERTLHDGDFALFSMFSFYVFLARHPFFTSTSPVPQPLPRN
jgi:hypothetical protein